MDAKGEVLLTILSSLAQDESRSISENSAWGIRRRFEQGTYKISTKRFLGYDYDKDDKLVVNKAQAKIVKRIYQEYLTGKTPDRIARLFRSEKAGGARVCSNRYVLEEALIKLFIMSWNEIAGNYDEYKDFWEKNLKEGDELLLHKTKQIMTAAQKGKIKELDGELMIMVIDFIKIFESGRLVIRFYDGTEFECETE